MTLETSNGKTYEALYVDGPTVMSGTVMARIYDKRPLPEIAAELDGLASFARKSEAQGDKEWKGYSVLYSIRRMLPSEVLVEFAKP